MWISTIQPAKEMLSLKRVLLFTQSFRELPWQFHLATAVKLERPCLTYTCKNVGADAFGFLNIALLESFVIPDSLHKVPARLRRRNR